MKFCIILGLGMAVLVGALAWRLSSGPIPIGFLTPYFESVLQIDKSGFDIKLEDITLGWSSSDKNFGIHLFGAKAIDADGNVIVKIPELAVTISGAALAKGKLAASSLTMFGPHVNVIRTMAGKLELKDLNFAGQQEGVGSFERDFVGRVFREFLQQRDKNGPLNYLRHINIISGNVSFTDRQLAVNWNAPGMDIFVNHEDKNIYISANGALRSAALAIENMTSVRLKSNYDLIKKEAEINLEFTDLNPRILASLSTKLTPLKFFDLPLSGTIQTLVTSDWKVQDFKFNLTSKKGRIVINNPIRLNVPVQSTKILGDYDQRTGRLNVKDLTLEIVENSKLKLLAPIKHEWTMHKVSMAGTYDFYFGRLGVEKFNIYSDDLTLKASGIVQKISDKASFELECEVKNLAISKIREVWPKGLADLSRDWVTQNVSEGFLPSGNAQIMGSYNQAKGIEVTSIFGNVDFQDVAIDHLVPRAKIIDVNGKIKFNRERFDIELMDGRLGKIKLGHSHVAFTRLYKIDQNVNAAVNIEGPFDEVLAVANSKPFGILKSFEFSDNKVKGNVSAQIAINFPFRKSKIDVNEVIMSAEVLLENVYIPKIASNLDLSEAKLVLSANNKEMKVKGIGRLGGVMTKILWHQNFGEQEEYRSKYNLKAIVDDQIWRKELKLKFPPLDETFVTGSVGSDVTITIQNDGSGDLKAILDLKDTAIALPRMGWIKSSKVAATATILAKFAKENLTIIPRFIFKGGGMNFLASASFGKFGKIKQVIVDHFRFGETDISAIVMASSNGKSEGWDIDIKGKRLDLISWLASEDDHLKATRSDPLSYSLNVDSVQLYPNKKLKNVKGSLVFDGWVWHTINLNSRVGENEKLKIFLEAKDGKRFLRVSSGDAGAVLQTFDYYENLIGGKLTLGGEYEGMLPDSLFIGHARIDDFRLIEAPVLVELLNVASITGIIENLQGVGLGFAKLYAPFESRDDVITIKDASISGLSLGITAGGTLNSTLETIDLKGTIVPVYALNTALTRIPIIGNILSGGEKDGGVFAATYAMTGSIKKPKISTDPLSVIAPGFLRGLFKFLGGSIKEPLKN